MVHYLRSRGRGYSDSKQCDSEWMKGHISELAALDAPSLQSIGVNVTGQDGALCERRVDTQSESPLFPVGPANLGAVVHANRCAPFATYGMSSATSLQPFRRPPSDFRVSLSPSNTLPPGNVFEPTPPPSPSPRYQHPTCGRVSPFPPALGNVYYVPEASALPGSIIHNQQKEAGFFRHPVIVTGVEGDIAYFYALTTTNRQTKGFQNLLLRIGNSPIDEGPETLRLGSTSNMMRRATWVNLERRYAIEWTLLQPWWTHVSVDRDNLWKLDKRVHELEADQNRCIYKPLLRDMACLRAGVIIMMPSNNQTGPLGSPVLIVENQYPMFRYLRVKLLEDNPYFNPETKKKRARPRQWCLEISQHPRLGHDGTPVLTLQPGSPNMRQPSYVEVYPSARIGNLRECKTWCWPPVTIRPESMSTLRHYMAIQQPPCSREGIANPRPNARMHSRTAPLSPCSGNTSIPDSFIADMDPRTLHASAASARHAFGSGYPEYPCYGTAYTHAVPFSPYAPQCVPMRTGLGAQTGYDHDAGYVYGLSMTPSGGYIGSAEQGSGLAPKW